MKKIIAVLQQHTGIHYAILLIATMIMAIPVMDLQVSYTHDGYVHILRLIGTHVALANTEFPHLVIPYFCNDFGYSMNLFYGVLVTYLPLLLKVLPMSYVGTLKLFAIGTIFFSGMAMYRCMLQMTKKKGMALVSALLYMTAIYRFENIYTRFAMGEFTAFVFLPIVLQGLHSILYEDGKKSWLLGIGITALVLTHTITTMYFAFICFLYVLLQGKRLWRQEVWKHFILQIGIALLLTAFYTVPMLEHKMATDYTIFDAQLMRTYGEWASDHTADVGKFIDDSKAPHNVKMEIGIPIGVTLLMGLFVIKKIPKEIRDIWIASLIVSIVSIFMCTDLFPWRYLPDFLCTIQYPWRMNGYFILFAAIAGSIHFYYFATMWKKEWVKIGVSAIVIVGILANTVYYTSFYHWADTSLDEKYERKTLNNLTFSHMAINRDYLPVRAIVLQSTYLKERENRVYVLQGTSKITQEEKEGLHLQFTLTKGSEGDILELPYFYYLGYEAVIQTGEETYKLPILESPYGFLAIVLPEDIQQATITIEYTGTILEKAAYLISGISVMGLLVYHRVIKKRREANHETIVENHSSTR